MAGTTTFCSKVLWRLSQHFSHQRRIDFVRYDLEDDEAAAAAFGLAFCGAPEKPRHIARCVPRAGSERCWPLNGRSAARRQNFDQIRSKAPISSYVAKLSGLGTATRGVVFMHCIEEFR